MDTLPEVTGEATYYAVFTEAVRQYTVTYVNGGETLFTQKVPYGAETPSYSGETPTKAADAQYSYVFSGWGDVAETVTGDAVYTAQFTQMLNEYTVTVIFTGIEGKEEQALTLSYGTVIDLTRFAEEGYSFVVSEGENVVDSFTVTGDAQLTVTYTEEKGQTIPEEPEAKGLTPGAIAGIVIGCVAAAAVVVAVIVLIRKKKNA